MEFFGQRKLISLFMLILVTIIIGSDEVQSHGRLIEPPSRSSAWRYGFNTTANYNDHEIYCGGFSRQYQKNNGKCGICGDAYDLPQPRPNEAGGVYGHGVLVRKYRFNSIIRIKVELTANHRGFFEFRLCPNNNPKKIATQKCLDTYVLQLSNGEGSRYYPSEGTKVFESRFLLPKGLTCTQCVLQWRYIAGNNWGECPNGTQAVGCGPQEEFRACADVSITDGSGHASSEENDTFENEIDTNKLKDETLPPTIETSEEPVVWPFVMAVIGLMLAAIGFGTLFGWFYRKEVVQFARNTVNKPNWKLTNNPNRIIATGTTQQLSPMTLSHHHHHHHHRQVQNFSNRPSVPPPVPPPRHKKSSSDLQIELKDEDYHNRLNTIQRKVITPDLISKPLSVSINGLAV